MEVGEQSEFEKHKFNVGKVLVGLDRLPRRLRISSTAKNKRTGHEKCTVSEYTGPLSLPIQ